MRRFGPQPALSSGPIFAASSRAPSPSIALHERSSPRSARRRAFLAAARTASTPRELLDVNALTRNLFTDRLPFAEKFRPFYGRIDMALIAEVLRMSDVGIMTPIADLERETLALDPHASMLPQKRFGVLSALEPQVDAAKGDGLDPKLAEEIAADVRSMISKIRGLRAAIYDIAWSLFDGRGALEIDWAHVGGKYPYRPVALDWIHPRRIAFGPDRELRVIDTFTNGRGWWSPNGIALRDYPGKFVTWMPRYFCDYPEREGLGRRSLYWCLFKRFSNRMRMVLTELFAIPWRTIEFDQDTEFSTTSWEDMEAAEDAAEALGGENSVAIPPGGRLRVQWPGENSGQLFELTRTGVNDELSKLWVLNTGTSDMKADALGGGATAVHKGEQNIAQDRDAFGIAEVFQVDLVDVYVLLNRGPAFLDYSPTITLVTKDVKDRAKAQTILENAIKMGVPVSLGAYYEETGVPHPDEGEPVIVASPDAMGNMIGHIVFPESWDGPRIGEPPASDEGEAKSEEPIYAYHIEQNIVARDEARAKMNLPPLPGGAGSVETLAANLQAAAEAAKQGGAPPGAPGAPGAPHRSFPPRAAPAADKPKAPQDSPATSDEEATRRLAERARVLAAAHHAPTVNGTEAELVSRGVREGVRHTAVWAQSLVDAIDDEGHDHLAAHRALTKAADAFNLEGFARAIERTTILSLALGALDSAWESAADATPQQASFREARGDVLILASPLGALEIPQFTTKPFAEAISSFLGKNIVSRRFFDRLTAEAKRRSFTVAGLAQKRMLVVAHEELTKAITEGIDLREFRARLAQRFESNGWTPLNKSHVETVFRTQVQGAYASGRDVQQRQPEVLEARPYWQIQGVKDDRTRDAHAAAHGKVLHYSDPFWTRAPLPWGFNERCRRVTRSEADLARLGLQVTNGAMLSGLPDEGFDAGAGGLFERGRASFVELCVYLPAIWLDAASDGAARGPKPEPAAAPAAHDGAARGPIVRIYADSLVVLIDRPEGTVETGTSADGTEWSRTWPFDGGELPGTQAGDGEPIDVFCGPKADAPIAFWLVQKGDDPELRLALGWENEAAAREAYGSVVPIEMLDRVIAQPVEHVKAILGLAPDARHLEVRRLADPTLLVAGWERELLDDGPLEFGHEEQLRSEVGKFTPNGEGHISAAAHVTEVSAPFATHGNTHHQDRVQWAGVKAKALGKPVYVIPNAKAGHLDGGVSLKTSPPKKGPYHAVHPDGSITHH